MAEENLKSQISDLKLQKIWHITDFEEIFMLGDDARKGRKGPLAYTKSFVSLSGTSKPCEVHHYERLKDLKSREERHLLRSVFEDLKSWAAYKSQRYQGYLVTHAGRPAEPDYIAAQIDYVDKNELKKAMRIFEKIGLIERVVLNGQFEEKNADCPDSSGNQPDDSGKGADFLKEGKAEVKGQAAPDEGKATIGLSASGCKEKGQGKGIDSGKTQQVPSHPLPIADEPTCSDAGGENGCKTTTNPSRAVYSKNEYPKLDIDYDHHDLYYGESIYEILNWRGQGKVRESTSFASVWHQCRMKLANSGLSPPEIDQFGIRGKRQAEKIARQKGNRAAKWNDFMQNLTKAKSG